MPKRYALFPHLDETKNLKRAVRRNIDRFPPDFMFELTQNEVDFLRCNFGTLKKQVPSYATPYISAKF